MVKFKCPGRNAAWRLVYFGGVRGDVSQAPSIKKFSGLRTLIDKMAAVNSSRDILCLFDVDGTVTPARLVRFSDRSLLVLKKGVNCDVIF